MVLSEEIMKDSITYHMILKRGREQGLAEGRAEGQSAEARAILLRLGRKRLGEPSEATIAALESIHDLQRLEEMGERLLDVEKWDDLLAGV